MAKTKSTPPESIDEYLDALPETPRATLDKLRKTIHTIVPEAEETISYMIPTFKYKGGLVGFGATVNHCALYVMSPAVMESMKDELTSYDTSKGTIRFPHNKPLPATLLKKIITARIRENEDIIRQREIKKRAK